LDAFKAHAPGLKKNSVMLFRILLPHAFATPIAAGALLVREKPLANTVRRCDDTDVSAGIARQDGVDFIL